MVMLVMIVVLVMVIMVMDGSQKFSSILLTFFSDEVQEL